MIHTVCRFLHGASVVALLATLATAQKPVPCLIGKSSDQAAILLSAEGFAGAEYVSDPQLRSATYATTPASSLPTNNIIIWQEPLPGTIVSLPAETEVVCLATKSHVLFDLPPDSTIADVQSLYPGVCVEAYSSQTAAIPMDPMPGTDTKVEWKTGGPGATPAGKRVPIGAIVGVAKTGGASVAGGTPGAVYEPFAVGLAMGALITALIFLAMFMFVRRGPRGPSARIEG